MRNVLNGKWIENERQGMNGEIFFFFAMFSLSQNWLRNDVHLCSRFLHSFVTPTDIFDIYSLKKVGKIFLEAAREP